MILIFILIKINFKLKNEKGLTIYPIVINCEAVDNVNKEHSHTTFATFEKLNDGSYSIKCLKQKQRIDGVYFLLQEVFGIEKPKTNRSDINNERKSSIDSDEVIIYMIHISKFILNF